MKGLNYYVFCDGRSEVVVGVLFVEWGHQNVLRRGNCLLIEYYEHCPY